MTCHDARELFSALLDDSLTAHERARLDAHLATCAECGRELERFRATVALVQGLPPERAPAGFVDRVTAAARPEPGLARLTRRLFVPWTVKLPLEAAALLLVGGLAALVFRGTQEQQLAARVEEPRTYTERSAPHPDVANRASEPTPIFQQPTGVAVPRTTSEPAQESTKTQTPALSDAKPPTTPASPTEPGSERTARLSRTLEPGAAERFRAAGPEVQESRQAPGAPKVETPSSATGTSQPPAPQTQGPAPQTQGPGPTQDAASSGNIAKDADARPPQLIPKRDATPYAETDQRQKLRTAETPTSADTLARQRADTQARAQVPAREGGKPRPEMPDALTGRPGPPAQAALVADVRGTLLVADATATATKIEGIVRGLGGTIERRDDGAASLLVLAVPRERYPDLVSELTRLGQWQSTGEPPALPPSVRLAVRLARPPS